MKRCCLTIVLLLVLASSLPAQNVSGYGMMPDPYLFLLREPTVHEDLKLTDQQRERLVKLNESFDPTLLAARNMPPDDAQAKTVEVLETTRKRVGKIFSAKQQARMRQIAYRLRGMSFVLLPDAAEQLQLTESQREQIQTIVSDTLESISKVQSKTFQGAEAHQQTQKAITAADHANNKKYSRC